MAFPPRQPRGTFNPRFKKEQQQEHRTNHMIKVPEVRLVGENVTPGIYPTPEAFKMAQDEGLDLVEISPGANPPVCKIIDYNKFIYSEKKKKKDKEVNVPNKLRKRRRRRRMEQKVYRHVCTHYFNLSVRAA